jgi:hypothetical protein
MDEESKKIILARRARFVAAALASVGLAGQACGGEATDSQSSGGGSGGPPRMNGTGGAPQPCLSAPIAGSYNTGGAVPIGGAQVGGAPPSGGAQAVAGAYVGGGGSLGMPQPCLGMALETGGTGGFASAGTSGGSNIAGLGGGYDGGAGQGGWAGVPLVIAGSGGVPQPCLSPPRLTVPPGGEGGSINGPDESGGSEQK